MYYSSGNYEAFARPKKPAGVDGKSAYIIGTGLAALSAACYLVRDAQMPGKNIHILEKDAVGPVPLHPVDRDRRRLRARRVLLAQQGRPQLFAVPRHQGPRAGCGTPGQIRAERQGLDGDHETVLHSGRGTVRQADHRFLRRRGAEIQLLAVLAHHVRVRELAFRAGNETVHQTVHPPHWRSAGLQRVAVHPIQPVRVDDPADGEVPRSARRAVPLQYQGRERRVCDRRRERTRT